jgi:hypothetical protein
MFNVVLPTANIDQYVIQIYHYEFPKMWTKDVTDYSHLCGWSNGNTKRHN